jgi:Fur family ferric uptake transcriptional regulator
MASDWLVHAHEVLEGSGRNRSAVRDRLLAAFEARPCALTVAELEECLRERHPDQRPPGRATVYRTLELLQEHQLINRVEVGDGITRYEAVSTEQDEHHHHLVCERCGRLYPFDDPKLERMIDALAARHGFEVSEHEVTLRGVCPSCVSA